ncbi:MULTISPECIES: lysophospholipid acyltransferase family protein [Ignavibacterium]|uniref:lysophospholipid acyltransferase family protein n=1 Tax=Ignavibacterium TaxID=795750 RepID=UPI0025B8BEB9|nr:MULTISPECIES: lysophospholipid acyltransferase family protein [Ignavibacterium]
MNYISIKEIINSKSPGFLSKYPSFVSDLFYTFINRILFIPRINRFLSEHGDKTGIEFIEELFEQLDISYRISSKDREKIPSEGKLIIVANHPLGGLDGLILLKLISEVRTDVKIIANDVLMNIKNLSEYFLPFDLLSKKDLKKNYQLISETIKRDFAIIIFPAGEVARLTVKGIKDKKWNKGAVYFADKFQAPVLPIFIKGRNSILFYITSLFSKKLSMFLLPYELFNKRNKIFDLKIGHPISPKALNTKYQKTEFLSKSLKKHLYLISKNKKGIFQTEKNIIHPVSTKQLRSELFSNTQLGETTDHKKIFLVEYEKGKNVLKEIARLREITFRKVGEGTGSKKDSDKFDKYYRHIVLWDDNQLEIVGSYRFAEGNFVINNFDVKGFYSSSLFRFNTELKPYLTNSIELGRSFIQSKYWNSLALDYLWQGIGKYLTSNRNVRYLFGPVSMSNNYSSEAKDLIIQFYSKWFPPKENFVSAYNPYIYSDKSKFMFDNLFCSNDYNKELILLKNLLSNLGFSIPVLFKQYADLCTPGGVQFAGFNIDKNFSDCIDAFIIIDLSYLKEDKRKRYLDKNNKNMSYKAKEHSRLTL